MLKSCGSDISFLWGGMVWSENLEGLSNRKSHVNPGSERVEISSTFSLLGPRDKFGSFITVKTGSGA